MLNLYLGPIQPGLCMRCGAKIPASSLISDGRNPRLLVCGQCYDPIHPQERPFQVNSLEGMARFPVSPDTPWDTRPVLTFGEVEGGSIDPLDLTAGVYAGHLFGFSDGSIQVPMGSLAGDINGLTVAELYVDTVKQHLVVAIVDALPDAFDQIVVGGLRFERAKATIEQIRDLRVFTWTLTSSPFSAGGNYDIDVTTGAIGSLVLNWTRARVITPRVEQYRLYRGLGTDGAFALLATYEVNFELAPDYEWQHPDTLNIDSEGSARYRVDAITDDGRSLPSNILVIDFVPPGPPVLSGELVVHSA